MPFRKSSASFVKEASSSVLHIQSLEPPVARLSGPLCRGERERESPILVQPLIYEYIVEGAEGGTFSFEILNKKG